jgi:3-hydroxybutyryl-CoA dehydrogenase
MKLDNIRNILIVGAGTMGHSIAQVYAQNGYHVSLVDMNQQVLENALNKIKSNLTTLVEYGRFNTEKIPKVLNLIHISTNIESVAKDADLVVEAVNEVPELKQKIFAQLEEVCSEETILASNTSTLDIFKIAKINKPSRQIIQHWFAPPHIIPLVEIVPGRKTSQDVIDLSVELMKKLGKMPIVLNKFTESFIVNKIQNAISGVVFQLMLMKISTPEDIDRAIKYSLGIRLPIVGVAQTLDFTGLDLVYDIGKTKGVELDNIKKLLDQGYYGAKTSHGIYDYGGRSEEEILKKRDILYLKMLDHLEKIKAFEPI